MSSLPSSCLRIRYLERLLFWVLMWTGLKMWWINFSMEDPKNSDLPSSLLVAFSTKNQTTSSAAASISTESSQNQDQKHHHNHRTPLIATADGEDNVKDNIHYLWTSNPVLPDWMKEYMDWHSSILPTLTVNNWQDYKYLVLRCYRKDERCGGVSDRLKPIPLMVLAAHRSHRILFIDWDRPCPLSEFLVPPPGGFQWTPPSFLLPMFQESPYRVVTRAANLIETSQERQGCIIQTHIHDTQGGMTQYDAEHGEGSFRQIYHDLFRIFFSPSPGVQRLIDAHLLRGVAAVPINRGKSVPEDTSVFLVEGEYSVAHYRAEYGKEVHRHRILNEPSFLRRVAINAIKCASELQPGMGTTTGSTTSNSIGTPIFFASDNPIAMATARELATTLHYPIVTFDRSEETPLKLDDYNTTTNIMPSDYFSTFVDLYVAGSGKCVTYGRGGFGRFASLLSFNASCSFRHVKQFYPVDCQGRPPFRGL